jgi:hypothetical protein
MYDDHSDDEAFDSSDTSLAVATTDVESAAQDTPAEWTGPRCEKCDAPMKSDVVTVCRRCGWYASLGQFLEVDPNWEHDAEADEPAAETSQKSHVRVWIDLLPRWSWVIIASVVVIVVESVVARLVTPAGSSLRTAWSLGQLAIGILAFIGCHIFNFLVLAAEDADVGVLDLVLKPLKLWLRAIHNLPARLWASNAAASGIAAALMSVLVIGGLPYERLWDWGFQAPVRHELMGAVMDRVRKLDKRKGADNLEDAIGDFAGNADGMTDQTDESQSDDLRDKADCVIIGYNLDRDGRLDSLELGTNYLSRLVYAGRVKPEMPSSELADLLELISRYRTHQALITVQSDSAKWVKPKYACRVKFTHRKKGRLYGIKWDRLLGRIGAQ